MATDDATRKLVYSSTDAAHLNMQLEVSGLRQVTPPGGGAAVPGYEILSGSITFNGPDGKVTLPINGSLPGQTLVAGQPSLYGIGPQGPALGGGYLVISWISNTKNYSINTNPQATTIQNVSCTPWPPGS
jgi:hypothetical protein